MSTVQISLHQVPKLSFVLCQYNHADILVCQLNTRYTPYQQTYHMATVFSFILSHIIQHYSHIPFPGALSADFWEFLTFQKSPKILERWIFGILTHKFAWRCQSIWLSLAKILKISMLTAVRVMAAWVTGPFRAKTQIICLRHEGLMTWVQCQLGFVGDLCSYQKTPLENFCD